MALKSFDQKMSLAYNIPDKETKLLKSAFMGLCSDSDRFFRMYFGIDIYTQVNEKQFYKIKKLFPNFEKLSLEQFNRLLFTFISIRDVNAHLFLNKTIYIDDDIVEFICTFITPKYALSHNKEATLYGSLCVALLFCQNYQLWTFNTYVIRHNIFLEVHKNGLADFQREFQAYHKPLLGLAKPIMPEEHLFLSKQDVTFFIEVIKKTLTKLIFDFEQHSTKSPKTSSRTISIKALLSKYSCLGSNEELVLRIVELRNIWLHGYRLFDKVHSNGKEFIFDFEYLFSILIDIKEAFKNSKYASIINDLNDCGSSMIDFYLLRSIEISYKILDNSLFQKEKTEERIANSVNAYTRCMAPEEWFYDKAAALLKDGIKEWYLTASKFDDGNPRIMKTKHLTVYEFVSYKGFCIGDEHYEATGMVLTDICCPIERQMKINGKYLEEYKTKNKSKYSFIDICQIDL